MPISRLDPIVGYVVEWIDCNGQCDSRMFTTLAGAEDWADHIKGAAFYVMREPADELGYIEYLYQKD
jgi:hypothetical protein